MPEAMTSAQIAKCLMIFSTVRPLPLCSVDILQSGWLRARGEYGTEPWREGEFVLRRRAGWLRPVAWGCRRLRGSWLAEDTGKPEGLPVARAGLGCSICTGKPEGLPVARGVVGLFVRMVVLPVTGGGARG